MPDISIKCRKSGKEFIVTDQDQQFYKRIDVPLPTLCPEERMKRRVSFRNDKNFYKRDCDLCKKSFVTIYSPDKKYPVYCNDCFWSDKWDPRDFGMEFDFNRPFFEQFKEL